MPMHHSLDPYPIPRNTEPLYINEPWLIDKSLLEYEINSEPDEKEDNICVYIPMDIKREAILRRLARLIAVYGEANEENESEFQLDVNLLISQIEIYDQVWFVRHLPDEGEHSDEAVELVSEFIKMLEEIPDGCAEMFPFETIEELRGGIPVYVIEDCQMKYIRCGKKAFESTTTEAIEFGFGVLVIRNIPCYKCEE